MGIISWVIGLAILVADIWAIINIIGSGTSGLAKVLWILLIVFLPLIGLVIWLIAGPRAAPA